MTQNERRRDGGESYTVGMAAKSGSWKVVKTTGGYGVLRSVNGSKVTKATVVKPSSVTGKNSSSAVQSSR